MVKELEYIEKPYELRKDIESKLEQRLDGLDYTIIVDSTVHFDEYSIFIKLNHLDNPFVNLDRVSSLILKNEFCAKSHGNISMHDYEPYNSVDEIVDVLLYIVKKYYGRYGDDLELYEELKTN